MQLTVDGKETLAATGGREFHSELPVVVFVHGAGMDHTVWALQTRYFAHHERSVLAIDLPGHGRSEGPPLETVEEMADWVPRLLDAAGVTEAAIVGHSMGSLVALECAARHPSRTRAIALLGAAQTMPVHPDLQAAADADDPLAYELMSDWALGAGAHLGGSAPPGLWMTGGVMRLVETGPSGVLANDFRASNGYTGADRAAASVSCSALVILGADDRMTPITRGLALAERIAGARVELIASCGHMMTVEQPDATLDALRTFI